MPGDIAVTQQNDREANTWPFSQAGEIGERVVHHNLNHNHQTHQEHWNESHEGENESRWFNASVIYNGKRTVDIHNNKWFYVRVSTDWLFDSFGALSLLPCAYGEILGSNTFSACKLKYKHNTNTPSMLANSSTVIRNRATGFCVSPSEYKPSIDCPLLRSPLTRQKNGCGC